jgi:hypothetical protein
LVIGVPRVSDCVKGPANQRRKLCQIARNVIPKIRCYVKDAKIDGELMSSLGNSIKILSQLRIVQQLNLWLQQKNTVKTMAAAQMESLNSLYKVQLQSASNAQLMKKFLKIT